MGSSSGFAAMANFTKVPYVITKIGSNAVNSYEIKYGEEKLPFASNQQNLIYEKESPELFNKLLKDWLNHSGKINKAQKKQQSNCDKFEYTFKFSISDNHINNDMNKKQLEEIEKIIKNKEFQKARNLLSRYLYRSLNSNKERELFYFYTATVLFEFNAFAEAKTELIKANQLQQSLTAWGNLRDKINAGLLLENLDRFLVRNTNADNGFLSLEKVRAQSLLVLNKYQEALMAIEKHSIYHLKDSGIMEFQNQVRSLTKKDIS